MSQATSSCEILSVGFGIGERLYILSKEVLSVEEGSLYPAL